VTQWLTGFRDKPSFEWTWEAARKAREGAPPAWSVAEPEFEVAEQAELQRELGLLQLEFTENKFIGRMHMAALPAQQVDAERYVFSGVASTAGNVDRMKRVILPGAFGSKSKLVPLLAYHDDKRPIGTSKLMPEGGHLMHESRLANVADADDFKELIKAGAIPGTSIGWLSDTRFNGWSRFQKAAPELARQCAAMGMPQSEDIAYFPDVNIVENSVVSLPANPMALIQAANYAGR
jgi:hypothetical protein